MGQDRLTRRAWLRAGGLLAAAVALAACGQNAGGAIAAAGSAGASTATAGSTSATTAASAPSAETTAPATATSTTATPTSTATTAAQTASTSASAPATTAAATSTSQATAASTSAATAKATTATTTAAVRAVKLTIDPAGTVGSYQVQEQLAGHDFPSQAIGKTSAVSGAIVLDANGKIDAGQSKIQLDLRTLKSDQGMRDNYIQHDPLQTSEYPYATFIPSAASGMPWPLPASGTAKFTLAGAMTIHGTTKPLSWAVTATFAPDKVTGTATSPFTFTEFGMQPPHTMIALSVQNSGTLTLQFTANRT